MKGHIRERSPGRWAIILDAPDQETGKRRRKWHSFAGTKREAQKECARLITEMQGGDYVEPGKETLAKYLDRWLDNMRSQVSPRSHERYAELARKNVVPLLGSVILTKLRPEQISAAYSKALVSGRRDGSGGLSPRTVHHMHRILRQALSQAVQWRILARNPADAVGGPKVEKTKMRALDAHETAQLLAHFRPTRMFTPVLLGALCGLRRGEVTALRWRAVDFAAGQLAIVESTEQTHRGTRAKETKSGRSRRVALPSIVADELRRQRIRQAEELLKLGVRLSDDDHVFAQADGMPVQPNSLTHEFTRILAQSSALPRIRFHDLRHSHATQMLASGIHPKIAQERLGHSSIGITLDLYSHVMPGMQEDAAAKVDAAMRAAIDRVAG
ncbi:integrase [Methylobacterium sp. Leaf125]|uniref:tyrosine-type recombinase/integrase n=1 Tax=Methylobacterium sp. Leaf125 TaxID=1736265 RepID=UPI0006FA51D0|nr:tyrosine-type recombinase/integrase [Methylobacterium sp. Leaf125]KQQ30938.1 integrase [Methylobacterium sp. Leaf125]